MTHKLTPVVLPMSKQGFQKEDLLKKANSIWLADINRDDDANGVKAQQLYLVSDRPPQNRELILRRYFPPTSGLTEKVCKYNPSVMDGHSVSIKRIEAAYPAIDGIPTISPADMQKFVERNGEVQWVCLPDWNVDYPIHTDNDIDFYTTIKAKPRIDKGYIVLKEVEKVETYPERFARQVKQDFTPVSEELSTTDQPDKTPLQMAIAIIHEYMKLNHTKGYKTACEVYLDIIKSLLPAERQFAEKCFEAGYDKGKDDYDINDVHREQPAPDFSTFYKKYEI
jgi:hypothetical protein